MEVLVHQKVTLDFSESKRMCSFFSGASIRHENIVAAMTGQKERASPIIDTDNDIFICYLLSFLNIQIVNITNN